MKIAFLLQFSITRPLNTITLIIKKNKYIKKNGWGFAHGLQKHVLTFDFFNHPTSAVVLLAVSFTSSTVTVCRLACL